MRLDSAYTFADKLINWFYNNINLFGITFIINKIISFFACFDSNFFKIAVPSVSIHFNIESLFFHNAISNSGSVSSLTMYDIFLGLIEWFNFLHINYKITCSKSLSSSTLTTSPSATPLAHSAGFLTSKIFLPSTSTVGTKSGLNTERSFPAYLISYVK